jgi:hypothetical protein
VDVKKIDWQTVPYVGRTRVVELLHVGAVIGGRWNER